MKLNKKPRFISLHYIIPNFITLVSVAFGVSAIRLAFNGEFQMAVVFIFASAFFDAMDGRMARLLKSTTRFGAELDSLADFVAFGVAPAFIFYLWQLHQLGNLGWAISILFLSCSALRLARFNVSVDNRPPFAVNFFQGVPAPMGAILGLLPVMLQLSDWEITLPPLVTAIWAVVVAGLMVSSIPTFAVKKIKIPLRFAGIILAVFVLFIGLLLHFKWEFVVIITIIYVVFIPFSILHYIKLANLPENSKLLKNEQNTHNE